MAIEHLVRSIITDESVAGELSAEETEFLTDNINPYHVTREVCSNLSAEAALRLQSKDWETAQAVAKVISDPDVLDRIARNRSVQVRRTVGANPAIADRTVEYLWNWGIEKRDYDLLEALAVKVNFDQAVRFFQDYKARHVRVDLVRGIVRAIGPSTWPKLLTMATRWHSPKVVTHPMGVPIVAAMVCEASAVECSLADLHRVCPEIFKPDMLDAVLMYAPVTHDTVEVLIRGRQDDPDAEFRYLRLASHGREGDDDDAIVRLFETDEQAARQAQLCGNTSNMFPNAVTWILERADQFPDQAVQMLGDEVIVKSVPAGLIEQALLAIDRSESDTQRRISGNLIEWRPDHQLSHEAILSFLRRQGANRDGWVTLQWLTGAYAHQQPTAEQVRELFATPGYAFGASAHWGTNRQRLVSAHTKVDLASGMHPDAANRLLNTPLADVIVDLYGEHWWRLVGKNGCGGYLLRRIRRDVGPGAETLRITLGLLDKTTVDLGTALRSARALISGSDNNDPTEAQLPL